MALSLCYDTKFICFINKIYYAYIQRDKVIRARVQNITCFLPETTAAKYSSIKHPAELLDCHVSFYFVINSITTGVVKR